MTTLAPLPNREDSPARRRIDTPSRPVRWRARAFVFPLADLLALTSAITFTGQIAWQGAGYAAAVLLALGAGGLYRLPVRPRVSDQAGRIAVAVALPALVTVLPWATPASAASLAAASAALVMGFRALAYATVRAARRRGLLTMTAVTIGEDEIAKADLRARHQGAVGVPFTTGLAVKRAFDVIVAAVLIALLAPALLVLALAVRIQLRQPPIFRQVRVVGRGRLAEIVKLRTLADQSDPDTSWVVPMERCTGLARFLRVTHFDELPQLFNVLRGEMSLVGPRPERPYFARRFEGQVPGYPDRVRMPAGLTGWAQVNGLTGDTSIHDRVRFDNQYIEYWSFRLDLVILARTVAGAVGDLLRGGKQ